MYYVYILRLVNGKFYIGFSTDLKSRIREHKNARVKATKEFLPLELVYYSAFKSRSKALGFEKYLKTNSGFAFRNKRLL